MTEITEHGTGEKGRWIWDAEAFRETGEGLVPAEEYFARRRETSRSSAVAAPMIIGDRVEYRSMHDGSMITGRRQHREHLREHGLVEYGNDFPSGFEPKPLPPAGRDVKEAVERVRAGQKPEPVRDRIDELASVPIAGAE